MRIVRIMTALAPLAMTMASCKTNTISEDNSTNTTIGQLCVANGSAAGNCGSGVCTLGYCRQTCTTSTDCPSGSICLAGEGDVRGCRLPTEAVCAAAKPCTPGLVCGSDSSCRNACGSEGTCAIAGNTCTNGACGSATEPTGPDGGAPDGGSTNTNCGKLDQACCASPATACEPGGSCAGEVCSCFAAFVGSRGILSGDGKLTIDGDPNTLLVDDAAMPFLVKEVVALRDDSGWHGTALRADRTLWGFGKFSGTTTPYNQVAPAPARVIDTAGNPLPLATRLGIHPTNGLGLNYFQTRSAIVNGQVYRWGKINGSYQDRATPLIANVNGDPLNDVVAYTGGDRAGYAILSNGTVLAHGDNTYGLLGTGSATTYELYPVPVPALSGQGVIQFVGDMDQSAATLTMCALLGSKEVACWGDNSGGGLGVGTSSGKALQPSTHVLVEAGIPLDNVVEIVGINSSFCALRGTDGTVWCWGLGMATPSGDAVYAGRVTKTDGAPLTGITKLGYNPGAYNWAIDAHGRFWKYVSKVGGAQAAFMDPQPTCP